MAVGGGVDVPDDKVINDIFSERTTKHADDAIDYEDIDELADEDEEELPEIKNAEDNDDLGLGGAEEHNLQDNANNEFDALFGDEEDANGEHEHGFQAPGHDVLDSHVGMDILDDFSGNMVYEDDGLHHLDLGFEDDKPESMNGKGTMMSHGLKKKRKSLEQTSSRYGNSSESQNGV